MSTIAVGYCSQCDAVVNVRWPSCLVCHAALPATSREASTPSTQQDWLTAWREVAAISSGLTAEDPRLPSVMAALGVCDAAFIAGNWATFQESKAGVGRAMEPGAAWTPRDHGADGRGRPA